MTLDEPLWAVTLDERGPTGTQHSPLPSSHSDLGLENSRAWTQLEIPKQSCPATGFTPRPWLSSYQRAGAQGLFQTGWELFSQFPLIHSERADSPSQMWIPFPAPREDGGGRLSGSRRRKGSVRGKDPGTMMSDKIQWAQSQHWLGIAETRVREK